MKRSLTLILALTFFICLLFTACGDRNLQCEHDYDYSIITLATCEEKGEMEGICSLCGKKVYQDVAPLEHKYVWTVIKDATCSENGLIMGNCERCAKNTSNDILKLSHNYVGGVCVKCGQKENHTYLPNGVSVGYTISDIFNKASEYGITSKNADEFVKHLAETKINSVNIDGNKIIFDFENSEQNISFGWDLEKVDYDLPTSEDFKIITLEIVIVGHNYSLNAIYSDGTNKMLGWLIDNHGYKTNQIKALAINRNNNLLVVLADNEIINYGSISQSDFKLDQSVLIYKKVYNGYSVYGCIDKNLENLVIPKTHRGLPVVSVGEQAFENNNKIKSIVVGENVKNFSDSCFSGCSELTEITLNKNIANIYTSAFDKCDKLTRVNYMGSALEASKIYISNNNIALTFAQWFFAE